MKKILSYILTFAMLLSVAAIAKAESGITIVSPSEESVIYEGETLVVKALITDAENVYKVAFSLNGIKAAEVYSSDSVECEIVGAAFGENVIKADALNALGEIIVTDSVTVNVNPNAAPSVSVAELSEALPVIKLSQTPSLNAAITDETSFEAVIELNGNEVITTSESAFEIDLSNAASGENLLKIYASDSYGKKSVYEKSFVVEREMKSSLLDENFDSYTSGTPSGFTNFVTNKGGALGSVATENEDYRTSLEFTASAIEESPDVDAHLYYGVSDGGTKPVYTLEASYYFPGNEENEYDATATLYFRDKNGSNRRILYFDKSGGLYFSGEGGTGEAASAGIAYSLDTWYDLKLVINTLTGEYDAYLNDAPIVTGKTNNDIRDIGISAFRFGICTRINETHNREHSPSDAGAKVYLDNLSLESVLALPSAEKTFSEGNENSVDGGVSDICVKMSDVILGSDVKENLTIENEIGEVEVKSASYDAETKTISISTEAVFLPNTPYTLTLKKGLKITDTLKTDSDIRHSFTVKTDSLDAENENFFINSGKLSFKADVVNNSGEEISAMAIVYVLKGNEIISAHCQSVAVLAGDTETVTVTGKPLSKGETATAYIFEMPDLARPITVKSYNYTY